jgi:phosphoribosyl 1,2-cyclic phosphodiesterase
VSFSVTFWGTRGSTPVPGPDTVRFGGNTPCLALEATGAPLAILDAGTGARALGAALAGRALPEANLLLTHTHWDHIQGLPFFAPLWNGGTGLTIRGPRPLGAALADVLAAQMQADVFPVPFTRFPRPPVIHEIEPGPFHIPGFAVRAFELHHPGVTYGYRIEAASGGPALAYVTDNELASEPPGMPGWRGRLLGWLEGVHTLVHDAMYTAGELQRRRGWGHSSPEEAIDLAAECGAARLVLFHHDPVHDDPDMDRLVQGARMYAAAKAPRLELLAASEGACLTL